MKNPTFHIGALVVAAAAFLSYSAGVYAETFTVESPSGRVVVKLENKPSIRYSITYDGVEAIAPSQLGLRFKNVDAFEETTLYSVTTKDKNSVWNPPFGKQAQYVDRYTEATLQLQDSSEQPRKLEIVIRVYDDGVAFRYVVPENSNLTDANGEFCVESEDTQFAFGSDLDVFASFYKSYNTSQEEVFPKKKLSDIKPDSFVGMPLIVCSSDFVAALTEADLLDWSGAQFATSKDSASTVTIRLTPRNDKRGAVVRKAPAASPWRVVILGKKPVDLINNSQIVQNVATPCLLDDVSWIEPGSASWDWWAPKSSRKVNNENIRRFVDFSAKMGWRYTLVDAGWSKRTNYGYQTNDATIFADGVNIPECVKYADEKNVGIWLWFHWTDLDKAGVRETLKRCAEWGVKGVKIDFMDSHAQEMVQWTTETCKIAAEYKLLVDFHGMYKPTGMERTYPNQITREGVRGNEYNRWSKETATHMATLPFTRCMLGSADYTPGGFKNEHSDTFKSLDAYKDATETCHVVGTRAHELALCMIYDSPFRCLCDLPEIYADQPGLEYLRDLPVVWDETVALDGQIGEYVVFARRSGANWFLSGITNEDARDFETKLDFLEEGAEYEATTYADSEESEKDACNIKISTQTYRKGDVVKFHAARDGGWNVVLNKKK